MWVIYIEIDESKKKDITYYYTPMQWLYLLKLFSYLKSWPTSKENPQWWCAELSVALLLCFL